MEEPEKKGMKEKIKDTMDQAKMQARAMRDPFGIAAIQEDLVRIGEITKAEKAGEPINLKEAKAIAGRIDDFIANAKKMPGMNIGSKVLMLGKIQRDMHRHITELEAKAKVQGELIIPEETK